MVNSRLWETAETETCKKSEPETLSAEDLEDGTNKAKWNVGKRQ